MTKLPTQANPCSACPYRKDAPSGLWAPTEYAKLPEYDNPTHAQPLGVFMCHDGDRSTDLCRGWLDAIDKENNLALRFACGMGSLSPEIIDLPKSSTPCFNSGQEACDHGMRDIDCISDKAARKQEQLLNRHPDLKTLDDVTPDSI